MPLPVTTTAATTNIDPTTTIVTSLPHHSFCNFTNYAISAPSPTLLPHPRPIELHHIQDTIITIAISIAAATIAIIVTVLTPFMTTITSSVLPSSHLHLLAR